MSTTTETTKAESERQHNELTLALGREYIMPKAKSFHDLFSDAKPWIHNGNNFTTIERDEMRIGSYCRNSCPNESLSVVPNETLQQRIVETMLPIEYDHIGFEIVDHHNGKSLVIANYNLIIGSRWLAYIDTDTVPTGRNNNP